MYQADIVKNAHEKLYKQKDAFRLVAGFDGFVNEIIHVVDKREDYQHFKRIETIEAFSKRIANYSGLSGNVELVHIQEKPGGSGLIYANALLAQNHKVVCIGTLGKERM